MNKKEGSEIRFFSFIHTLNGQLVNSVKQLNSSIFSIIVNLPSFLYKKYAELKYLNSLSEILVCFRDAFLNELTITTFPCNALVFVIKRKIIKRYFCSKGPRFI